MCVQCNMYKGVYCSIFLMVHDLVGYSTYQLGSWCVECMCTIIHSTHLVVQCKFEIKHFFSSMTTSSKSLYQAISFGQGLTTHLLSWLDKTPSCQIWLQATYKKVKTFQHPFVFLATYLNHHVQNSGCFPSIFSGIMAIENLRKRYYFLF